VDAGRAALHIRRAFTRRVMTNQAVSFPPPTGLSSPQLSPLDSDHRLHTLDILRGLALFGMIMVHFHQKMRIEVSGLEDLIAWAVWILVEQKAISGSA
jgi:hypothetical protein